MPYQILADTVVIVHLAFIILVVTGGLIVLRWPRFAWVHVPIFIWGVLIEFTGWICPLTPLENWLRAQGGQTTYTSGFIEHYIMPIIYPLGLTRELQFVFGMFVLVLNVAVYAAVIARIKGKS